MRRLSLVLAVLFATAPAHAASQEPVDFIAAIYKTYGTTPDPDDHSELRRDFYSQRLLKLIEADEKATPKGEVGRLDFDVFVNGNNWELSNLKIVLVSRDATHAKVRVNFENFKFPRETLFSLIREGDDWRIDEIQSLHKPRWTLSKILTGAPDAFPDERK